MPGKVILAHIGQVSELGEAERWLITRGYRSIAGVQYHPELAPDPALFRWMREQKVKGEPWWEEYTRRFIDEMSTPKFEQALNSLRCRLDQGRDVALICFCRTTQCHRYLVGQRLAALGYVVESLDTESSSRSKDAPTTGETPNRTQNSSNKSDSGGSGTQLRLFDW
ncbi:MAG: DUF488 domain-containing protein [Limnochordales bacterium]|nr:DUF488 domain-containing protein [Limnochordales bacterium]